MTAGKMSVDEAVAALRADPSKAQIVHDAFLGPDVLEAAERFRSSGEFSGTLAALGGDVKGWRILDLGAGNGIASYAFAKAGARVTALEPDPSALVGREAMRPLLAQASFEVSDGLGEKLPFADASFDLVYARQVLHHIPPLGEALKEMARVLKPGGRFLACREHVYTTEADKEAFLAAHPTHQLAGNEGAHRLGEYRSAILGAGLRLEHQWGPLEGLINSYPLVKSEAELKALPLKKLERLGALGRTLGLIPGMGSLVMTLLRSRHRAQPGRLYTFLASKPL